MTIPSDSLYDCGDGFGPVPGHRHPNGGGWVAQTAVVPQSAYVPRNIFIGSGTRVAENVAFPDDIGNCYLSQCLVNAVAYVEEGLTCNTVFHREGTEELHGFSSQPVDAAGFSRLSGTSDQLSMQTASKGVLMSQSTIANIGEKFLDAGARALKQQAALEAAKGISLITKEAIAQLGLPVPVSPMGQKLLEVAVPMLLVAVTEFAAPKLSGTQAAIAAKISEVSMLAVEGVTQETVAELTAAFMPAMMRLAAFSYEQLAQGGTQETEE